MKVFDLVCEHSHVFEGWFDSTEAFESQQAGGMVECPMCGSASVTRKPSAPRLNLSSGSAQNEARPSPQKLQQMWMQMARHIRNNTEDVGERFAEEARRIHYQEAPARGIRGVATPEQSESLADEGIEVFSFPMPKGGNEPLQ
jgi:hypothetical protein